MKKDTITLGVELKKCSECGKEDVVKCFECKNYDKEKEICNFHTDRLGYSSEVVRMKPYDFCSYGDFGVF